METLTVETTSSILEKLRICFTDGTIDSMVKRRLLKTLRKDYYDRRYSGYNYTIQIISLVEYLTNKGFTDNKIKKAMPEGIEL
jgi:hypothetical protein